MVQVLLNVYLTVTTPPVAVLLASCLWLYLAGSFFFDIVHYALHQCSKSPHRLLRRLGYLHQLHHLFFNRNLKFKDKYHWFNIFIELPLELSCQLFGSWLGWLIAKFLGLTGSELLSRELFVLVLLFEVARVVAVAILDGRDSNHISYSTPPKDVNWFLVGPEYHALHHINPTAYISSTVRVFDWFLGTICSLQRRRIAITGASGAFGSAMKTQLQAEGVNCVQELHFGTNWSYEGYESTISILVNTDVLVLADGSRDADATKANCESVIALIELFKKYHKPKPGQKMLLPEIWYVGSEIELYPVQAHSNSEAYPTSQQPFLPHARKLYDDTTILYRHIVLSTFQSAMGRRIVSADWAAKASMWWIRRGARYVPVSYTGLAYLNYFKFMYWTKKA
jgi:hypothetical protein